MMFCKFCGASIDGDSVFCKSCGKNLNSVDEYVEPQATEDIAPASQPVQETPDIVETTIAYKNDSETLQPAEDIAPASQSTQETLHFGICEDCGRRFSTKSGLPFCGDCYNKHNQMRKDFPKKEKSHMPAVLLTLGAGLLVIILIVYFNQTPESEYTSYSVSSSSTTSSEYDYTPTEYEKQVQSAFNDTQWCLQAAIKKELKNPLTLYMISDSKKFVADTAKFTHYGNITYTNASDVEVTTPFECCVVATDMSYFSLYLKMGETVLYDFRYYTDNMANLTAKGAAAQGKAVGSSIFSKNIDKLICITAPEEYSSRYVDEYSSMYDDELSSRYIDESSTSSKSETELERANRLYKNAVLTEMIEWTINNMSTYGNPSAGTSRTDIIGEHYLVSYSFKAKNAYGTKVKHELVSVCDISNGCEILGTQLDGEYIYINESLT